MTKPWIECPECEGEKTARCERCENCGWVDDPDDGGTMTCPECNGDDCPRCEGEGVVDAAATTDTRSDK